MLGLLLLALGIAGVMVFLMRRRERLRRAQVALPNGTRIYFNGEQQVPRRIYFSAPPHPLAIPPDEVDVDDGVDDFALGLLVGSAINPCPAYTAEPAAEPFSGFEGGGGESGGGGASSSWEPDTSCDTGSSFDSGSCDSGSSDCGSCSSD